MICDLFLENPLYLNFTKFFSFSPPKSKGNQKIFKKLRHGTQGLGDSESLGRKNEREREREREISLVAKKM